MKNRSSCSGSFLGLLFLLFLVLKLTQVIDWSWWWVTSPLWLPAALGLGVVLLLTVLGVTGYKVVTSLGRKAKAPAGSAQGESVVEARGTEVGVPAAPGTPVAPPPAALPPGDGSGG